MSGFWRHPVCLAPRLLRPWLADRGSLTARLKARFSDFQVRVIDQRWQAAHADEANMLQTARADTLLATREVLLLSGNTPLVFAHSITTRAALQGGFQLFGRIGSRPLGESLFADPTITRSPLSWRCVDQRHPLWQKARAAAGPLPAQLWARRSLFHSGQDGLLVTEVFLPTVITTP